MKFKLKKKRKKENETIKEHIQKENKKRKK